MVKLSLDNDMLSGMMAGIRSYALRGRPHEVAAYDLW